MNLESGKSSFLHLLALLDDPSKGRIILRNKDTKNFSDEEKNYARRTNISIIFQDNNLLTIRSGENTVRILPPLNVKKSEIDIAIKIIKKVCEEF